MNARLRKNTRKEGEESSRRKCHSQKRTAGKTDSPNTRLSTTNAETSAQEMRRSALSFKVARRGIGSAKIAHAMKVRELMTKDVATVGRNDELTIADDIMNMKRLRHLPVVEDGRLVGILTQRDLFHAALSTALNFGEKAQKEFLKTVVVKEVMTDEVLTIDPGADIKEAARRMMEHKVGCLPVVENGKLVGLVTETDLLRVVAG
jgi:CBS domain-containing protein